MLLSVLPIFLALGAWTIDQFVLLLSIFATSGLLGFTFGIQQARVENGLPFFLYGMATTIAWWSLLTWSAVHTSPIPGEVRNFTGAEVVLGFAVPVSWWLVAASSASPLNPLYTKPHATQGRGANADQVPALTANNSPPPSGNPSAASGGHTVVVFDYRPASPSRPAPREREPAPEPPQSTLVYGGRRPIRPHEELRAEDFELVDSPRASSEYLSEQDTEDSGQDSEHPGKSYQAVATEENEHVHVEEEDIGASSPTSATILVNSTNGSDQPYYG
ncbi:hypothetical protein FA95DRAFT_1564904 [Auriscalpium vulgare]|uniref:Uncharacterized protein n=1 Tax=Auriscalpium vulgare TaxID=40419 RepID=A0ACB8RCM7_9AGAM|nr:hypothetical protein FA95DRAFT_1564904 [Auriscalpium vulgare]